MTYESLDVLTTRIIASIGEESRPRLNLIESPAGIAALDRRLDWPGMTTQFLYYLNGHEEIDGFRTFLDTRCGRLVPFWIPTWSYDLRIIGEEGAPVTQIGIRRIGYTANMSDGGIPHIARRFLFFYNNSSAQMLVRKVTGVTVDGGDPDMEIVTLNSALPDDPTGPDTWEQICFLNYVRLAQDGVDLTWLTPDAVKVSLNVQLIMRQEESG